MLKGTIWLFAGFLGLIAALVRGHWFFVAISALLILFGLARIGRALKDKRKK